MGTPHFEPTRIWDTLPSGRFAKGTPMEIITRTATPLVRFLPAALLALAAGCATAPPPQPQPQPLPEPVEPVAVAVVVEPVPLRPDYPERYVVKKGDTLWDISAMFLRDPWRWPEVWQNNPQIDNPHLIYPGDILTLVYIEGRPVIQVQRPVPGAPPGIGRAGYPTVKLSPQVRVESLERAIPTIPAQAIRPFLSRPRVVSNGELEAAPYIVSTADEHLIAGTGNSIYVRRLTDPAGGDFVVVRRGQAYRNPLDPEEILGYEAIHVADARLQQMGDPATLLVTAANREVLNADRLIPAESDEVYQNFLPRAPAEKVEGHILAVLDGVSQIGQYQSVVLDLGRQEALEAGHVLAVYQAGEEVRDPITGERVKLPPIRAGIIMVYRVFERVSYALVMEATRAMHVRDRVTTP